MNIKAKIAIIVTSVGFIASMATIYQVWFNKPPAPGQKTSVQQSSGSGNNIIFKVENSSNVKINQTINQGASEKKLDERIGRIERKFETEIDRVIREFNRRPDVPPNSKICFQSGISYLMGKEALEKQKKEELEKAIEHFRCSVEACPTPQGYNLLGKSYYILVPRLWNFDLNIGNS